MLIFLVSCFSFVLLSNSLSFKSLPTWVSEKRLLYICFWKAIFCFFISSLSKSWATCSSFEISSVMSIKKKFLRTKVENEEETNGSALLDLPDLALDCILERLDPNELCKMAEVCDSLRDRCRSDYFWERHMKNKWGEVIGQAAYREWELHNILMKDSSQKKKKKSFISSLSCVCSISWGTPKENKSRKSTISLPVDSLMSLYLRLESGKFWFPAQVYNRENGHVGFVLSCYDAQLFYDCFTDTFQARYPPHGPRPPIVEDNVEWDRIRAPAIDNPPRKLYDSDCLEDLHPGDHIEIQWRRNKEFPYGWWYGVVGHLDTCDKIQNFCCCEKSDSVVLEFNQYSPGSRWRTTIVSRKDHREQGSEVDGFYGGIRKLYSKEQISVWKNLWPKEILQ